MKLYFKYLINWRHTFSSTRPAAVYLSMTKIVRSRPWPAPSLLSAKIDENVSVQTLSWLTDHAQLGSQRNVGLTCAFVRWERYTIRTVDYRLWTPHDRLIDDELPGPVCHRPCDEYPEQARRGLADRSRPEVSGPGDRRNVAAACSRLEDARYRRASRKQERCACTALG